MISWEVRELICIALPGLTVATIPRLILLIITGMLYPETTGILNSPIKAATFIISVSIEQCRQGCAH